MKSPFKLLVADDEEAICTLLQELLSERYYVETLKRGDQVIEKLYDGGFSLLILDLHLPGINGLDILQTIHDERLSVGVVILTASNDVEKAITAIFPSS